MDEQASQRSCTGTVYAAGSEAWSFGRRFGER